MVNNLTKKEHDKFMAAKLKKYNAVSLIKFRDSLKLKLIKFGAFKILLCIFGLLIIYLQAILWFGDGSLSEIRKLKKSIALVEQENEKLHARNQQLIDEVEALRHGLDLIEHRAREDLGLVKKNEVFYHLIDQRTELEKNPETKK